MIFGPKGVKFQVVLQGPKKYAWQKYSKQLDSNGRSDLINQCSRLKSEIPVVPTWF